LGRSPWFRGELGIRNSRADAEQIDRPQKLSRQRPLAQFEQQCFARCLFVVPRQSSSQISSTGGTLNSSQRRFWKANRLSRTLSTYFRRIDDRRLGSRGVVPGFGVYGTKKEATPCSLHPDPRPVLGNAYGALLEFAVLRSTSLIVGNFEQNLCFSCCRSMNILQDISRGQQMCKAARKQIHEFDTFFEFM